MSRISGPIAILAGFFLTMPGILALIHAQSAVAPMPGWLQLDLLLAAIAGVALMVWGGSYVRQRELERNDLEPIRLRVRH